MLRSISGTVQFENRQDLRFPVTADAIAIIRTSCAR
jgi:hypothetical protein